MFLVRRPSPREIERYLLESRELPLSYYPTGLARQPCVGFQVDERVTTVGSGEAAFGRAKQALVEWTHFDLGWVELFPKRASIAPGTVVAVLLRHFGFWSLNGCRVVYSVDAEEGAEFGFAYGMLTNHAEQGEWIFAGLPAGEFQVGLETTGGEQRYTVTDEDRARSMRVCTRERS